jgi:hypothetical protein
MRILQFSVRTSDHLGANSPNFEEWILLRLLKIRTEFGQIVNIQSDPPYSISIHQARILLWLLDKSQPRRKLSRMKFPNNPTGLTSETIFRETLGKLRTFFRVNLRLEPYPPQESTPIS